MKRIGEILIEHGSLTQDQLKHALARQKDEPGKLLGKVLIEMGFVTETDIAVALTTQFNVPYLSLGNFALNESASKLVPKELIQKYHFVPLTKMGDLINVVMADPTNEQAIREIEVATKCKVQVFVATATEISTALQRYFHINVPSVPQNGEGPSRISARSQTVPTTEEKPTQKV